MNINSQYRAWQSLIPSVLKKRALGSFRPEVTLLARDIYISANARINRCFFGQGNGSMALDLNGFRAVDTGGEQPILATNHEWTDCVFSGIVTDWYA